MFNQLSAALKKTARQLSGRGRLSEANIAAAMREVRIALLQADVALEVARAFVDKVQARALGAEVLGSLSPGQAVIGVVRQELVALMGASGAELTLTPAPAVILVAGLQGVGKTTTVGKLAWLLRQRHGKSVLAASADVYRPAAIEQLRRLAAEAQARFFPSEESQDPAAIATAALAEARRAALDVVIIDTAGRLHIDTDMMAEIQRIHAAVQPVETLFVADGTSGQDAARSAAAFAQALPLSGVVLSKIDGDARGGAALSVRQVTGKPIKFIGTGEGLEALEPFHPERIASRILGMGDVLSLVEQAERQVDQKKAAKLAAKISTGRAFDLADFRDQLAQMAQLGGMSSLLEKLPAMNRAGPQAARAFDDKQSTRAIAVIDSMTAHERRFPAVLRSARKKRIAAGAGTQVQDVNRLLKQFQQMQKTMKKMHKKGGMHHMMARMKNAGLPGGF